MTFRLLLLLVAINLNLTAIGQFTQNYTPIKINGNINVEWLKSPDLDGFASTAHSMGFNNKEINRWTYAIKRERNSVIKTGNIYYNDEISDYVIKITQNLLDLEPSLKGKIHVYVSKSPRVNAFAFPDGTIIINLGLIAVMENESQLASTIAHELMHVKKKHMLNERKRLANIEKQELNVYNPDGHTYRSLSLSRDAELEADAGAASLLFASKYNAMEMAKSLEKLKLDSTGLNTNLEEFFKNEYFNVDTNWINNKAINKKLKSLKNKREISGIFSRPDDIYLTHPEVDKRIIAISEILKSMNYSYTETVSNNADFSKIRLMARFEIAHNAFQNGYYPFAIFQSIQLLEEFPENKFLKINIMKSLYWLSFYKEVGQLDKVLKRDLYQPGISYTRLHLILSSPDLSAYRKMMYGFIKKYEQEFAKEEEYMIILAQATEAYIGKEPALFVYRKFAAEFPQSNYINFVAEKLK